MEAFSSRLIAEGRVLRLMTLPASHNVLERQTLTLLSKPRLLRRRVEGELLRSEAQDSCKWYLNDKRPIRSCLKITPNGVYCIFSTPDSQLALGLIKGHITSATTKHCGYFRAIFCSSIFNVKNTHSEWN